MSEWKECKLGDMITLQRGHDLPKSKMVSGNIPVAGSNGIIGYHEKATTKALGVTIGRSGNLGNAFLYRTDFWAHNTTLYVREFKGNDELFVYYLLKSIDFKQFNVGSAVPTLNRNHIHPLDIKCPPLPEQKAIAGVLSSLDDKIDLLHRQNKTLEAMAETLFRQWFIEEAEDNAPSVSLNHFADNIKRLVDIKNLKKYEFYVGLEHIPRKSISLQEHGSPDQLNSSKFHFINGDILFGKLRPYFHKVVLAPFQGVCSTDILVIRAKKREWLPFCLFWFFSKDVVDYSDIGSGGTRMPRTSWEMLSSYKVPSPDQTRILQFNEIVYPILDKIFANQKQIVCLTDNRNTLLPKLMSGEVRVEP